MVASGKFLRVCPCTKELPAPHITDPVLDASVNDVISGDRTFIVYFRADNEVVNHAGVKSYCS